MTETMYDVAIVGSGISGPASAYVFARYTNVRRIVTFEKEDGAARVNSGHEANSQTLHVGDIETNYDYDKARRVRDAAEFVAAYCDRHPDTGIFRKMPRMVLGVGKAECAFLMRRFLEIHGLYPRLRYVGRDYLAAAEPALVAGRDPREPICALVSDDGYVVNFGALAESFLHEAEGGTATVEHRFGCAVTGIRRVEKHFVLSLADETYVAARAVIVAAGPHSLQFAHALGYGRDLALLPVAGDFYRSWTPKLLQSKVYTCQHPDLPFAAMHGDPDVIDPSIIRFGPTAKMLPMLERHRYRTIMDFIRVSMRNLRSIASLIAVLRKPSLAAYAVKNLAVDLPYVGKWIVLRDVRKIVPAMQYHDLDRARGVGGIRPQIVNTKTMALEMGEGRIAGHGIVFNVTPSPGASVCLAAAERDVTFLASWLGFTFDAARFHADHRRTEASALVTTEAHP